MILDRIEQYVRGLYTPGERELRLANAMTAERGDRQSKVFRDLFQDREGEEQVDVFTLEPDEGEEPKPRSFLRGSSPWYCARRMFYALTRSPQEPPAPRTYMAWYLGRCVESMVQRLIVLTNPTVTWPRLEKDARTARERLVEHVVTRNVGGGIVHGHVDLVLDYEGHETPVEIKSTSEFGFKMLEKRRTVEDTFGHLSQLNFYMDAMGSDRGFYVAVNKSTGHALEMEVRRDHALIIENDASGERAINAAASGVAPAHPEWAALKRVGNVEEVTSIRCGYCPYTERCLGVRRETRDGKPVWQRSA